MEGSHLIILFSVVVLLFTSVLLTVYTVRANRRFKPMPVTEAEEMVEKLILERYGKQRGNKRSFYNDFVLQFPEYAAPNYSYNYILQCLRPTYDRHNPDMVECVLRFFEKTYLVEGSAASAKI